MVDDLDPEEFVDAAPKNGAQLKQADLLIQIAQRGVLFHNHEGVAFADIANKGHRETWPIRSAGFRSWLLHCYFDEHSSAPNQDAVKNALGVIEAVAVYRGGEHPVAVRVGGHAGRIYLDLCNERWQAAEVDAEGWRVVDEPPIRFIRSRGMLPLPNPVRKKKTKNGIRALRKFINVKDDADFALVVAWELAAFRDHGPYPRAGAHSPGPETPMICTSQLHARTSFRSTTLVPCRNGSPTPCAGSRPA